jgi:hypothetical protein
VLAVEDVSAPETADTLAALGTLGPTALILLPLLFAFAVIVVVAVAWIIVGHGLRVELHGLRFDLRLFQTGEPLPELEKLEPPRILGPLRRLVPAETPALPARETVPVSRKAGRGPQASRPT